MADISKCAGEGCEQKENCYRFRAPGSYWQSYIAPDPKNCEYFQPLKFKPDAASEASDSGKAG